MKDLKLIKNEDTKIEFIEGGICAPCGFSASGLHAGVKTHNKDKKDLAVIVSSEICNTAAVYTKNKVQAAHIHVDKEHLSDGKAQAVIVNSGNANACAPNDKENAEKMCEIVAQNIGCKANDVLVASTGVIGQELNLKAIENATPKLFNNLEQSAQASDAAAHAIMTTDTVKKEHAIQFEIDGTQVHIGGIAKGSGMIHPNMGTMLCFITSDISITQEMLHEALLETVNVTFNRISVDGDTSTNDTCIVMANGLSNNTTIETKDNKYQIFVDALKTLCTQLAIEMASDGEGAKHLITCKVENASSEDDAEAIAKSVISSTLTKAAIFGYDANWGRVLCAMGYCGIDFEAEKVDVSFASKAGTVNVCKSGKGLDFDEELAEKILQEHDVEILINMNSGSASCTCWGCDITYDYIHINGDYRT